MKENVKRIFVNNIPFLVLFIMSFVYHMRINLSMDDVWFSIVLDSSTLGDFLKLRYETWSSRTIIEAVLVIMTSSPIMIWRIIDTFIFTGIAWLIAALVKKGNVLVNWLSCSLCLLYPVNEMQSAGYLASTINYVWPMFFVLISIYLLREILFEKEKVHKWEYVLAVVSIILGANGEQGAAILFGTYLMVILYELVTKKKIAPMVWIGFIVVILELIYVMKCPGNTIRKGIEINAYFPDYQEQTIFRLVEIGASSAMYHFIFVKNLVFAFFAGALYFTSIQYVRKAYEKMICILPFLISICFSIFSSVFYDFFPGLAFMKDSLGTYGTFAVASLGSVLPWIVYIVTFVSILYCVYVISRGEKLHSILLLGILILGFGSRFMMFLSASIWVSGNRTYIYMYFAFIAATVYLISLVRNDKLRRKVQIVASMIGCFSYFSFLAGVL